MGQPHNLSVDIYIKISNEINIKVNTTIIFTNLTFMILINGILPTNIVFAVDEDIPYGFNILNCTESGEYLLAGTVLVDTGKGTSTTKEVVIENFGSNGIDDIYYIENGEKVAPKNDGNGRVSLEAGKKYFYNYNVASIGNAIRYGEDYRK